MDLEKESLIVRSRVMVEELNRMADARDQHARFSYMSQPIRRVWRRSAG